MIDIKEEIIALGIKRFKVRAIFRGIGFCFDLNAYSISGVPS
jgi:hypothetical protein